jgi:hypothetical protein
LSSAALIKPKPLEALLGYAVSDDYEVLLVSNVQSFFLVEQLGLS